MTADTHATPAILTPAEVAARYGVTTKTVARWANAGRVRSFRTAGGHRRYYAADHQASTVTVTAVAQHLYDLGYRRVDVVRLNEWADGSTQEVYADGSSGPVVPAPVGEAECGHPNHGADDHDCRPFRAAPSVSAEQVAEVLDRYVQEGSDPPSIEPEDRWRLVRDLQALIAEAGIEVRG